MQGPETFAVIVATTMRLAIDTINGAFDVEFLHGGEAQRLQPVGEAGLKHLGIEQRQHDAEDILARHAMR